MRGEGRCLLSQWGGRVQRPACQGKGRAGRPDPWLQEWSWLSLALWHLCPQVVRKSDADRVTVIGAGVTLHEALAAADELAKQGTHIRVIDLFTIKPLDAATIVASARATGGRIITVEDHYREGGIGEAVAAAVSGEPGMVLQSLAVSGVPRSGKPAELLDLFGISAKSILAAVKSTFAN
ncbi:transketolase-like protein 2 [Terrapene carolina triunguis]|uniref:transketolase-like protein 2 n=1 Tax=Terrapene triunguis TaxID=2587831 RepID=UPI000CEF78C2|nr:transketolase-like protein 2 [Terrapene carolina triunguis]